MRWDSQSTGRVQRGRIASTEQTAHVMRRLHERDAYVRLLWRVHVSLWGFDERPLSKHQEGDREYDKSAEHQRPIWGIFFQEWHGDHNEYNDGYKTCNSKQYTVLQSTLNEVISINKQCLSNNAPS